MLINKRILSNTRRPSSEFEARVEVRNFLTYVPPNYNGRLRATETTNRLNLTSTDNSCLKCCVEKASDRYVFGMNAVFILHIYPGRTLDSVVAPWALYLPLCHSSVLENMEEISSKLVNFQQLKQNWLPGSSSYQKSSTTEIFFSPIASTHTMFPQRQDLAGPSAPVHRLEPKLI